MVERTRRNNEQKEQKFACKSFLWDRENGRIKVSRK